MIVVDENLHDRRLMKAIADWSPGRVISGVTLRPKSLIKDDAIPALLRKVDQPTFVTINEADFWKKVEAHSGYCIVNIALPKERIRDIPELLRRFFRLPEFKSKAARMGKVVRLTPSHVEYYESDRRIQSLSLL